MVFYRRQKDSKSPQVSRSFLGILPDLNNIIVWMVSVNPPISNSFNPLTKPLRTIPSTPIIIGITVNFLFHSLFSSQIRSKYLSLFSFFPTLWSARTAKSTIRQVLFFFLLIIIRSVLLAGVRWSLCTSKSQRTLCISFSRTDSCLCIYHLFVWSNFSFLHNSQWITFSTKSCLDLYWLRTNLLHSLIMWFIVSFLSIHNRLFLFYCVLSIFTLT